jgi:hypothetical protein
MFFAFDAEVIERGRLASRALLERSLVSSEAETVAQSCGGF